MTKPFIYTDVWKSCIFVLYKKKEKIYIHGVAVSNLKLLCFLNWHVVTWTQWGPKAQVIVSAGGVRISALLSLEVHF